MALLASYPGPVATALEFSNLCVGIRGRHQSQALRHPCVVRPWHSAVLSYFCSFQGTASSGNEQVCLSQRFCNRSEQRVERSRAQRLR